MSKTTKVKKASSLLRRARKLIERGFCRGVLCDEYDVEPNYCVLGALAAAGGIPNEDLKGRGLLAKRHEKFLDGPYEEARIAIKTALDKNGNPNALKAGQQAIYGFNDRSEQQDVVDMLKRAEKAAKQREATVAA